MERERRRLGSLLGERGEQRLKLVFFCVCIAVFFRPFSKVEYFGKSGWRREEGEKEAGSCLGREAVSRGQRPHLQSTALPMAQRVHQVKKKEENRTEREMNSFQIVLGTVTEKLFSFWA